MKSTGTESETRRHKFVSFTDRVAAVHIDPIRRIGNRSEEAARTADVESYFIEALDKWQERCLAANFTSFADAVRPLALSFPMIIHNQAKIAEVLLEHVKTVEVHSAEPLLDLLTALARDLGADFEPYFGSTLQTLIEVASRPGEPNLEVLERVFNCLAYLFKYLARLLTTDLKPTYQAIAPLFGRTKKQRAYVLRFAAESMAFLVRRCQGESLSNIVEYIVHDVEAQKCQQYSKSTSILLATAFKSAGNALNSRSPALAAEILGVVNKVDSSYIVNWAADIFVQVLHHTRQDTAQPVIEVLLRSWNQKLVEKMIFVVAGLRKGDRVEDWKPIWERLFEVVRASEVLSLDGVMATATVLVTSSFEYTAQNFEKLSKLLFRNTASALEVYRIAAQLNPDLLKSFIDPLIKPKLVSLAPSEPLGLYLLETETQSPQKVPVNDQDLLEVWWKSQIYTPENNLLEPVAVQDLEPSQQGLQSEIVGALVKTADDGEFVIGQLNHLASHSGLLSAVRKHSPAMSVDEKKALVETIQDDCMSWDTGIRRSAVELCRYLFPQKFLDQCLLIDDIPHDISNARNLSMHIRTLATNFASSGSDYIADIVVPRFMFGLLASRFQPIWTAALEHMPAIASKNKQILWDLAYKWIEQPPQTSNLFEDGVFEPSLPEIHQLDCVFLAKLQTLGGRVWADYSDAPGALKVRAAQAVDISQPVDLRILATKALQTVPLVAEKHGDLLVPLLLHDDEDAEEAAYKERLALLELFAKFTKPRKLQRFDSLYQRYLYFAGSRHLPVQRVAVKCILSVNSPEAGVLRKYKDSFEALLDEKRFKDELTSLVSSAGDGQEDAIHDDDRAFVWPTIIRLLYGRAQIVKASGGTRANARHAVLSALHYLEPQYQVEFARLAAEQLTFESDISSLRRQQGYLTLAHDFSKELQSLTVSSLPVLIPTVLNILEAAATAAAADVEARSEDDEEGLSLTGKVARTLRQNSIRLLDLLLSAVSETSVWAQYMDEIYARAITPRLENFGRQNLEQPSALMNLLATFTSDENLVVYLREPALQALLDTLEFGNVKEAVVKCVLKVVIQLIELDAAELCAVAVPRVISRIPALLERGFSADTLATIVGLLSALVTHHSDKFGHDVRNQLIRVALQAMSQPTGLVPTPVKSELLSALSSLLVKGCDQEIIDDAYKSLARLFRLFSDQRARNNLARLYDAFGTNDPQYALTGKLVIELNATDPRRLGLPDFDRRLAAFAEINEKLYKDMSPSAWLPVLYNMLFFIRDPEELALRNNASYCLRRFVDAYAVDRDAFQELMDDIVLPAIRLGLRERNDAMRSQFTEVFAYLVERGGESPVSDLSVLVEGDEELNFFYNINHIQTARRRKALQRLATITATGAISGMSLSQYILPMIEHFVAFSGSKDVELNGVADETLSAIGVVTRHITFNQFRAITRRYIGYVMSRPLEIRKSARLVSAMGTALEHPSFELPSADKFATFILNDVVAPLHKLVSQRTNEHENLPDRITLAVPIVHFLKALPDETIEAQLPGKLGPLAQLLRSKVIELRDSIRATLARAVRILGPRYFSFVVDELRSALRRGSQLHVLGYTIHALLLELKPVLKTGDLDAAATTLSAIIMEDTFGATGQEKDADGYVTAAKEVKQHKSYDSAEILAGNVSLTRFGTLVGPVKELLLDTKLSLKLENKIEELLRRYSSGLHRNPSSKTQEGLVMAFQLFQSCSLEQSRQLEKKNKTIDPNNKSSGRLNALEQAAEDSKEFYTVRLSSRHWDEETGPKKIYTANLHLLQAFVLEATRTILSGTPDLLTVSNVKGLLPLIQEGVNGTFEDVQVSALRLAALALRLPVTGLDEQIADLGRRTLVLVKSTTSTGSDLCQACLKFLGMLFRYRSEFSLKDTGIGYLLDRVKPDIEEPDRQGTSIGFVRAILGRRLMLPQVYDIMDKVANVLVTNQNPSIRSSCRAAYLQFLIDYPHGQKRLDKHFAFLVSNLQYPSATGRLSVMEMINMVVRKVHDDNLETSLTSFFVGLVLVIVNDDDADCRATASALVKKIFERSEPESQQVMVKMVISWLGKLQSNTLLVRGGLETVAMMAEHGGFLERNSALRKAVDTSVAEIMAAAGKDSSTVVDWQLVYLALQFIAREKATLDRLEMIETTLLYPHPWVRAQAGRIVGNAFVTAKNSGTEIPMDDLNAIAKKLVRQMSAPSLPNADGVQIVKNLVFIVSQWTQAATEVMIEIKEEIIPALGWLIHRTSIILRSDIYKEEAVGSKTAAVQLLATLAQVLNEENLRVVAPDAIHALYLLVEQVDEDKTELRDLAQEALGIFDKQLGTTEYLRLYTTAKQLVSERRIERKTKRSVQAINEPALHARKKMKKNFLKKESRKRKSRA